jgi:predicted restriction endonuclease
MAGWAGLRSDHIKHWADGGETSLENTLLLCSKHHRLLHEGGFTIKKNYKGERYFETSQGKVVT